MPGPNRARRARAVEQERGRLAVDRYSEWPRRDDGARLAQAGQRAGDAGGERAGVGVAERAGQVLAVDQVAPLDRRRSRAAAAGGAAAAGASPPPAPRARPRRDDRPRRPRRRARASSLAPARSVLPPIGSVSSQAFCAFWNAGSVGVDARALARSGSARRRSRRTSGRGHVDAVLAHAARVLQRRLLELRLLLVGELGRPIASRYFAQAFSARRACRPGRSSCPGRRCRCVTRPPSTFGSGMSMPFSRMHLAKSSIACGSGPAVGPAAAVGLLAATAGDDERRRSPRRRRASETSSSCPPRSRRATETPV